jgi:hypothetical protein
MSYGSPRRRQGNPSGHFLGSSGVIRFTHDENPPERSFGRGTRVDLGTRVGPPAAIAGVVLEFTFLPRSRIFVHGEKKF